MVHPDAVFDTGMWTRNLLEQRASHYGVLIDEYKRRNLLGVEVTSSAVGRLVADLCSETFACTTGAQVPIDGGNERVV
jgi:enoyl-[acyl-carrier-protein] reductase (NADH)